MNWATIIWSSIEAWAARRSRTLRTGRGSTRRTARRLWRTRAKANAFVVALGTNDAKVGGDEPIWPLLGPHEFADAYEHVLDELRDAADEEPIMFVATPIPAKNPSGKWPDVDILNVEMPPVIEGIAHDNDAILD